MNFLNRAVIYMIRNLKKTGILLGLIILLGTVFSGAVSVRNAIHNTEANLRA